MMLNNLYYFHLNIYCCNLNSNFLKVYLGVFHSMFTKFFTIILVINMPMINLCVLKILFKQLFSIINLLIHNHLNWYLIVLVFITELHFLNLNQLFKRINFCQIHLKDLLEWILLNLEQYQSNIVDFINQCNC